MLPAFRGVFQFTHPGRGATQVRPQGKAVKGRFNSRTPGGVRRSLYGFPPRVGGVSIHAPREGCDVKGERRVEWTERFNSRTPGGVRHRSAHHCGCCLLVSIHAPREGCDHLQRPALSPRPCFNSRTPGGVRPDLTSKRRRYKAFQFTHPGRGATQ